MTLCDWCDERFDEFVDGELCADDAAMFSRHIEFCESCQTAVDKHFTFVDSAQQLRQRFRNQHKITFQQTGSRVRRAVRNQQIATAMKVSAVVLIVGAVGWKFLSPRHEVSRPAEPPTEQIAQVEEPLEPRETTSKVQVEIEDSAYVAVPVENKNPNITIFWLHPTFDTNNDSQVDSDDDSTFLNQQETLFASKSL